MAGGLLGLIFGGGSSSSSNQSTTNNTTVTDNRVGVADHGTYVGGGATVTDTTTNDSHNITNVLDGGAIDAAASITTAGINASALVSAASITANQKISQAALDNAKAGAAAALAAQQQTASDAINAVTANSSDALALARAGFSDTIQFAHDTQSGFISEQADLNALVGNFVASDQSFATSLVSDALSRSQSADQQNFEATLKLIKYVAAAAVVAIALPALFKGGARA